MAKVPGCGPACCATIPVHPAKVGEEELAPVGKQNKSVARNAKGREIPVKVLRPAIKPEELTRLMEQLKNERVGQMRLTSKRANAETFTPAQQVAVRSLDKALKVPGTHQIVRAESTGLTSLFELYKKSRFPNAEILDTMSFLESAPKDPIGLEEAFANRIREALKTTGRVLFIDDAHLVLAPMIMDWGSARPEALWGPLKAVLEQARKQGTNIIFGSDLRELPPVLTSGAFPHAIGSLGDKDYAQLCRSVLGAAAKKLDFKEIDRRAPRLTAPEIRNAAAYLKANGPINTDAFMDYIRLTTGIGNVDRNAVHDIPMDQLRGQEETVERIMREVVVPFINPNAVAAPQSGALLVGPPGTGKTSILRALTAQADINVFQIDTSKVNPTSCQFYGYLNRTFDRALQNGGIVLFDDLEKLLQGDVGMYLVYPRLLAFLNGVDNNEGKRVTLIGTAVDASKIPADLVRNGRFGGLIIETKLPEADVRTQIIEDRAKGLQAPLVVEDAAALGKATEGFSPADLNELFLQVQRAADYDHFKGAAIQSGDVYATKLIEEMRATKKVMEKVTAEDGGVNLAALVAKAG